MMKMTIFDLVFVVIILLVIQLSDLVEELFWKTCNLAGNTPLRCFHSAYIV